MNKIQSIYNKVFNKPKILSANTSDNSIPLTNFSKISGDSQIRNLTNQFLDVQRIQQAFRSAESGDTRQLFTYFRDLIMVSSPVTSELSKRKLAVLSENYSLLPIDKENNDDLLAVEVIRDMIEHCPSWNENLVHLMNSIIYPVAVAQKVFRPWDGSVDGDNTLGVRYYLKAMAPVDYSVVSYKAGYTDNGSHVYGNNFLRSVPLESNSNIYWDPNIYEPDLRLCKVNEKGEIDWDLSNLQTINPEYHMVYRTNLLTGIAPDNYGGLGKSIMMWVIISLLGRETWVDLMNRFGKPYIVATANTSDRGTMDMLEQAFSLSTKLNALVVNKDAVIQLQEINLAGAAEGNQKFMQFCNDQISLLISGQTLGSSAVSTGLGSGVANLQAAVRQDIIEYDRRSLNTVLKHQLFNQYLRINGFKGRAPNITWGGGTSPDDAKTLSETLAFIYKAGMKPTTEAIDILSSRLGFNIELIGINDNAVSGSADTSGSIK